jgi:hypothetical protein
LDPSGYSSTLLFFFSCAFLSAWLSFSISYLMLKSWMTVRDDYLLGLPIGFALLALAYVVLDVSYIYPLTYFEKWAQSLLSVWGFIFLAATYYARSERKKPSRMLFSILCLFAITTIAAFSLVAFLSYSAMVRKIASSIVNLMILGYIIFRLNQGLKSQRELSSVVLGFTFLAIEQCALLFAAIVPEFVWSIIFAQLVRIAGLVTLTIFLVRGFQSPIAKVP